MFCGKIGIHTRSIGNRHAESNGYKSITNIIDAYSYTVFDNLSPLNCIYNEYITKTNTKKGMAPKETMGGFYKMLSENKAKLFSSFITIAT